MENQHYGVCLRHRETISRGVSGDDFVCDCHRLLVVVDHVRGLEASSERSDKRQGDLDGQIWFEHHCLSQHLNDSVDNLPLSLEYIGLVNNPSESYHGTG